MGIAGSTASQTSPDSLFFKLSWELAAEWELVAEWVLATEQELATECEMSLEWEVATEYEQAIEVYTVELATELYSTDLVVTQRFLHLIPG